MIPANRTSKHVVLVVLALCFTGWVLGCGGVRAAHLYREGTAALNAGKPVVAISQLTRAGALAPEASEIQNHLGLAFATTGQHEKALSAFQRAVDLDCANIAAAQNLVAARASTESEKNIDPSNAMNAEPSIQLTTELSSDTISEQAP